MSLLNAITTAKMSTPQAKRRRLNEAAKTLHKPFKSPFRTPLKPNIGSDPPSSDPPDTASFTQVSAYSEPTGSNSLLYNQPTTTTTPKGRTATPVTSGLKPPINRPSLITTSRTVKSTPSKPSVAREIMQIRNDIQMLTQAQTLATSTKDDDLVILVDKWRTASRAAAEELFGSTRDRVNRMGGVGAWKEREKESKERQMQWDKEEQEAERERMEEAKENGEVSDEAYDGYTEMAEAKMEEEKETFKDGADDDVRPFPALLYHKVLMDAVLHYGHDAQDAQYRSPAHWI